MNGILGKMARMRAEGVRAEPCTAPETQNPNVFQQKEKVCEQYQREGLIRASNWVKPEPTANLLVQRERAEINPLGQNSGVKPGIIQGQATENAYKLKGKAGSSLLCLTDQTEQSAIRNLTEEGQGAGPQGPPSSARKYSEREESSRPK